MLAFTFTAWTVVLRGATGLGGPVAPLPRDFGGGARAREPIPATRDFQAVRAALSNRLTYTKTEASLPHKVKTLKESFLPVDNYVSCAFIALWMACG
jgi:hypothetical protein